MRRAHVLKICQFCLESVLDHGPFIHENQLAMIGGVYDLRPCAYLRARASVFSRSTPEMTITVNIGLCTLGVIQFFGLS